MIHYQNKYDICPFILVVGIFKTLWQYQCTKVNAAYFAEEHKCYRSQGIESVSWANNWCGPFYAALNYLRDLTWLQIVLHVSLYHQYAVELHRNHVSLLVWPCKEYVTKLYVQITKHAKMLCNLQWLMLEETPKQSFFPHQLLKCFYNTLVHCTNNFTVQWEKFWQWKYYSRISISSWKLWEWTSHILQNKKLVWITGRILEVLLEEGG